MTFYELKIIFLIGVVPKNSLVGEAEQLLGSKLKGNTPHYPLSNSPITQPRVAILGILFHVPLHWRPRSING